MQEQVTVLILLLVICGNGHAKHFVDDYCWRDYVGVIPSDALQAGLDKGGNPLYIGQVLFNDKLINGKIFSDSDYIYFDWFFKEHSKNKNVKIFCTNQPQKFEWVTTSTTRMMSLMTRKSLVSGGFEDGNTYIGRTWLGSEQPIGKIIVTMDECLGLFTTDRGKTSSHDNFEVLTYNHNVNDTSFCEGGIDIRFSETVTKI